jgi:arylsulfatase A-like enzyme
MRDEAGYHTMVVGKTHLHDGDTHMDEYKGLLAEWGFADAIELPDPQEWWWESAHSDYLTATTPAGERDKYARWQEYVQAYHWTSDAPDQDPWKLATEDHLDSFCGQAAADFVRAWDGRAPLYLQVCFPGPHKPFDPTTEFLSKYDPDDPAMPLPNLLPPQPPIAPLVEQYMGPKFEPWDLAGARALRAHYYGKLSLVDAALGQVIQALKDQGLYDSSWIVFHSDHGELLADHSLTGKVLAYEGAIRVPLLVKPPSWTGAEVGWEDPGQVDQLDVTSTLLAIGGLDPTGYGDRDLTDRALGGPDGPLVGEDKPAMFENLGTVGIRDGALTMSWDLELGHPVELYDRDQDPDQVENRVADPALREDLDRLVTVLRSLRPLDKDEWNP